jgi:hypothetical protein
MWTLTETRGEQPAYCTEASDLGWRPGRPGVSRCPDCTLQIARWTARTRSNGEEVEITAWAAVCPRCGVALTVFND